MSTSTPSGATGAKTSKKARTAASAGPRDAISRPRTRKRLPSLHEMPFDIFLEILLQIDPKGLINLARTNKDARKALVNPNMEKTLWKRVREESEATEPPPGWSEAKWISFLFVSFCFSCGKANATNDFYILKRLCNACKKAGVVAEWALPRSSWLAPGEAVNNDSYLAHDYVLYTRYRQSIRGGSDTSKYYWNADLNATLSAWKALCANNPGGRAVNTVKELVEFKEERKAYVRDIQRTALKMVKWEEKAHRQRRNYLASNKELLVASIRKRFADLDIYKQEDIEKAINMKTTGIGGSAATEVTNRTWKTWRAKLEPSITRIRDTRVRGIRQIRMDKILDQWDTWLASLPLPAFERLTYPDSRDIWHLPEVTSIREANPDTIIDDSAYHAIFNRFPNIASSFVSNKRIQLREMVPDWGRHPTDLDPLELATGMEEPTDLRVRQA
ncbi:hypothetical protein FA13DRAFT_1809217 [Coprinellus micaceus]|uniref:F-box domain-containing protein n=1 Tax=Coprinellus micaceus TaxID=71717 RepID=A0A4Y7TVD4_COPMI|nr:hypothetical protein FA13DRAFT_1809217 [Coprinellus micaceus]